MQGQIEYRKTHKNLENPSKWNFYHLQICEGYVFTGVCLSTGGWHAWWGACMAGGVCGRGCAWQGACVAGGHTWQGGMHGGGGMCGRGHAWWGACIAVGGGHVWQGECAWCWGMCGRYYEIWSMSGRYASYWNAFLQNMSFEL